MAMQDQKVKDLGGKTGSPNMFTGKGDQGRGRHIKQAKRLSRRPIKK